MSLGLSRCKPTYEGLKDAWEYGILRRLRCCKPTYEGLKASLGDTPPFTWPRCKPTYEGLKAFAVVKMLTEGVTLQAYL